MALSFREKPNFLLGLLHEIYNYFTRAGIFQPDDNALGKERVGECIGDPGLHLA